MNTKNLKSLYYHFWILLDFDLGGNSLWTTEKQVLIIKNRDTSKSLPCLQANNLTCSSFLNTARQHEPPASETEQFFTHSSSQSLGT